MAPAPLVVVQAICTHWTKRSRGGTAATRRNATPAALALPHQLPASADSHYLLHTIIVHEAEAFRVDPLPAFEVLPRTAPLRYSRVRLYPAADRLKVVYLNPTYPRDRAGNVIFAPE